jgi:hypothetical protein
MDFPFGHLPIEIIDKYLQEGGGFSLTRAKPKTVHSTFVKRTLMENGWKKSFIDKKFKHLNDDMIAEWPNNLFINNYLQHLVSKTNFTEDLVYDFQTLGIKKTIAQLLGSRLKPLENTCYTHQQLLFFGIEFLMGKYAPITTPKTTHPFFPNRINMWTMYATNDYNVLIYNIKYRCNPALESILIPILTRATKDDHNLYFHATNWGACLSILNRIDRTAGRACLDFGKEPSFYLSTTLRDSLDWGQKLDTSANSHETGIIIFSLPKI